MIFTVLFVLLTLLAVVAGVWWLLHVARHDSPYDAKVDNPIPPAAGPERDPDLDKPVNISAVFVAFDAQRRDS